MPFSEGETMKPISIRNDSASQRSFWKFAFLALILICLLSSLSLVADDQASKAVRRSSSDVGKKVALVIGNKDYKDAPLRNPVNDAEDLSSVLKRLGFIVAGVRSCVLTFKKQDLTPCALSGEISETVHRRKRRHSYLSSTPTIPVIVRFDAQEALNIFDYVAHKDVPEFLLDCLMLILKTHLIHVPPPHCS